MNTQNLLNPESPHNNPNGQSKEHSPCFQPVFHQKNANTVTKPEAEARDSPRVETVVLSTIGATAPPPALAPELAVPVYQTLDRGASWDSLRGQGAGGQEAGGRAERQEVWAWGTGTKWMGAPAAKGKLNFYSGPPRAEMFDNAPKVWPQN